MHVHTCAGRSSAPIVCSLLPHTGALAQSPRVPWSTDGVTEEVIANDGVTQTIKASDGGNPIAMAGRRFMHLRITRFP